MVLHISHALMTAPDAAPSILKSSHLLGIEGLSAGEITALLDLADSYVAQNRAADKKSAVLRGRCFLTPTILPDLHGPVEIHRRRANGLRTREPAVSGVGGDPWKRRPHMADGRLSPGVCAVDTATAVSTRQTHLVTRQKSRTSAVSGSW